MKLRLNTMKALINTLVNTKTILIQPLKKIKIYFNK